jgi:ABC-2 type transport system permease protein
VSNLIRAELSKLRTIRTFWGTVAATLAFVPVSIALAIGSGTRSLDSTEGFRNVMGAGSSGGILMILIGIVVMAGEFRFSTVTSTFLITPDRKRVVGAKLISTSIVGAGVGVVASVMCLAIALPWLSARHVSLGSHLSDIVVVLIGGIGSTALGGVIGVGIGSLLRNQTLAITVTLVWALLLEGMLTNFASGVGRWFPGGAAGAMSGIAPAHGTLLPIWAATLLLIGYGLAFAAVGTRFVVRRDII